MLLNQMLMYLKTKYLILISILLFFGILSSCQSILLKKYKQYEEQFEIINYVFPPAVDSVLCTWLDNSYDSKRANQWSIKLSRYNENSPSFGINKDLIANCKKIVYCVALSRESYLNKKVEFKYTKDDVCLRNGSIFKIIKTNRKAAIGKGKYIIPIVFDYDDKFLGYGRVEPPWIGYSGGDEYARYIVFSGNKILKKYCFNENYILE